MPALPPRFEILRCSGPHARAFLQRMLSNALPAPDEPRAAPAFLLADNGRIVGGAAFVATEGEFLALCPAGWSERLRNGLLHYRVADRVDIDLDPMPAVYVASPPDDLLPAAPWGVRRHGDAWALRWPWTGLAECVWLGAGPPSGEGTDAGLIEAERIAAGTAAFGRELDETTIPVEAALVDWLSPDKGCYVGQEVVERMWSRDRRARRLVVWRCNHPVGDLPALPAAVADGAQKAVLTSAALHPHYGMLALGWLPNRAAGGLFADDAGNGWQPLESPPAGGRVLPVRRLREGT